MASSPTTVAFIVEQAGGAGDVTARPMFGEYGVYLDGKLVALICDGALFVKPTAGGSVHAAGADLAPPYPGAKPALLIDADRLDDSEWIAELFRITARELPPPKPRAKRTSKATSPV